MKEKDRVMRALVAYTCNKRGFISDDNYYKWFLNHNRNPPIKSTRYGPSLGNIIYCLITRTNNLEMVDKDRYVIYRFLENGKNIEYLTRILGKKTILEIKKLSESGFSYFDELKEFSNLDTVALSLKYNVEPSDVVEMHNVIDNRFSMLELD